MKRRLRKDILNNLLHPPDIKIDFVRKDLSTFITESTQMA